MTLPRAALFDFDDTIAESFRPPARSMLEKLERLMARVPIAVISAAGLGRYERDLFPFLEASPHVRNFYALPNSSAQAYVWRDGWHEEYSLGLTQDDRRRIREAIQKSVENPDPRGRIIDREVQVAYASIGFDAPLEEKKAWDPLKTKRGVMRGKLAGLLPDCEVLIGGMTTIDITKKNVNKAYGVRWLSERLGIPASEMLYVGDAFYEGGNDAVVIPTGIRTRAISGPAETESVIDELLAQ